MLQHYPQPEPAVSQVKLVDGPVLSAEGGEWSHRTSAKRKTSTAKKQLDFDVDGAALCILFGILLICNLTILIKGTLFPENPPSVLGITPMVVLSGSMSGEAEEHIEVGERISIDHKFKYNASPYLENEGQYGALVPSFPRRYSGERLQQYSASKTYFAKVRR